ncbi:endonuclease/exonuclease/phosphatase family protein, partial [archaeon]
EYIGQALSVLNYYKKMLNGRVIITGDFNWNRIWNSKKDNRFDQMRQILKDKSIQSCYHDFFKEDFGKETKPTEFHTKKFEKQYHVDYCFASSNFKIKNVVVGDFSDWIKSSDHVPIMIAFEDNLK